MCYNYLIHWRSVPTAQTGALQKGVFVRILGIDPGYATVGFGVIDAEMGRLSFVDCGVIETSAGVRIEQRLKTISDCLKALIERHRPDCVSMEELFFYSNQTTAINVAQARGVLLYTCECARLPISEYTPMQVKSAVVGYGRAEKRQVMEMTRMLLKLPGVPRPDDAADALAVAICHAHTSQSSLSPYQNRLEQAKKTAGR